MAVYTQVSAEALAAFLTRFDIGELVSSKGIAEGVENSNYLVDTTIGRFILTLYEKRVEAKDLPFFRGLTDHLAGRGNPVPRMIADRHGEWLHELCGRPACVIDFLPGVSASHPTATQAHAAGAALGEMHASLADFTPERPNSLGIDSWRPLLDRCGPDLDRIAPGLHRDLSVALDEVLRRWPRGRTGAEPGLPVCAIHADLFPDNVLMRGDRVTGLIDFYFACTDALAYDLAVCLNAWCFAPDGGFDPARGRAMLDGYRAVRPLAPEEARALPVLARGAALRFMLTRLVDWLNVPPGALVKPKDPLEYLAKLRFHRTVSSAAAYGLS